MKFKFNFRKFRKYIREQEVYMHGLESIWSYMLMDKDNFTTADDSKQFLVNDHFKPHGHYIEDYTTNKGLSRIRKVLFINDCKKQRVTLVLNDNRYINIPYKEFIKPIYEKPIINSFLDAKKFILKSIQPFFEKYKKLDLETYINNGRCFIYAILLKELSNKYLNVKLKIAIGPYHVFCKDEYGNTIDVYNPLITNKPVISKEGIEVIKECFVPNEVNDAIDYYYRGVAIDDDSYRTLNGYFNNVPEAGLILTYIFEKACLKPPVFIHERSLRESITREGALIDFENTNKLITALRGNITL